MRIRTVEPGAAWVANYLLELAAGEKSTLTAKAQLGLGGLALPNTFVRLLTGDPSISARRFDLTDGYGSLDAYLFGGQMNWRSERSGSKDPYEFLFGMKSSAEAAKVAAAKGFNFGGGFGGTVGGANAYLQNNSVVFDAPASYQGGGYNGGQAEATLPTRVENIFSYEFGKVDLQPGDRLARRPFQSTPTYRTLVLWQINEAQPQYSQQRDQPLQQIVRVLNDTKMPWTGGNVLVVKDNNPIVQAQMPFTSPGKSADVPLGKAEDLVVNKQTSQVSRESVSIDRISRTKVDFAETVHLENTRNEPVNFEVVYEFYGQDVMADGATIRYTGTDYGLINKRVELKWSVTIPPGQHRDLNITFNRIA